MPARVDSAKCTNNGICVDSCPVDAITYEDDKAVVDEEACIDCGACIEVCPVKAIEMVEEP